MRKGKISNIQKKYLTYTLLLLALTIVLSSVGVWIFMRKNMTEVIVDNYVFMNEKMGMTLDYLYTRSDETTAECILDDAVQESLKSRELEEMGIQLVVSIWPTINPASENYQEMSEEQIDKELVDAFRIVLYYYKNNQTKEMYEYWLERTHHLDV